MFNSALEYLQGFFGYSSFRESQEPVIKSLLEGYDTLAIMPTGGGKSICYQIPSMCFEGTTIVVSPLISLMKDQVDSIIENGFNAAYINSSLSSFEVDKTLNRLSKGKIKLLYVAPERLLSRDFLDSCRDTLISQVAIDEAHCISQWGHDFRPSYKNITTFINSLNRRPIISAFTATATKLVKEDIINLLNMSSPNVYVSGFNRENLHIKSLKISNKLEYIKDYLIENKGSSGIIYASTRREVNTIYEYLNNIGIHCGRYHAGLLEGERSLMQEEFVYDKSNIIVATNAFGMGIDKSNVRFVIHYNMPKSIEAYYQEIGRAGRDGIDSECILLFSPKDISVNKYLIEVSCQNDYSRSLEEEKLQLMINYVYTNHCLKKYILEYFGDEASSINCEKCSNCTSEGEVVDKTLDTQKVLSCVYRMKKSFGSGMVVDVLRGSTNKKVIENSFDTLSTYGIMKNTKKDDLLDFVNTLISHGYLDITDGKFPLLKLNPMSMKVLRGEVNVLLKQYVVKKSQDINDDLFELLKAERLVIARENKIPPYFVFSDSTLKNMVNTMPIDEKSFINVSGVGEKKLQKYGSQFLRVINSYNTKKNA
ncbi:MAG: DNA helicase RecQ [Clostridium sp.]|uniref:DNA helicase RecQ n=1 Tax=Clostridium sp. TaxID=1506 RepID=UPI002FCAF481